MPAPSSAANSAAAATVVPIDPRLMRSPKSVRGTTYKKEGPHHDAAPLRTNEQNRLLCGFGRRGLAEIRRPIDFLARVGQRDLRALGKVHVRVAALDDAADQRDVHPG